jgi:hypothetical protein
MVSLLAIYDAPHRPSAGFIVARSQAGRLQSYTQIRLRLTGQVYYVNARNWQPLTGSISCDPAIGRCDAFMDVTVPR